MEYLKKYWWVLVLVAAIIGIYIAVRKGVIDLFDGKSPEEKQAEEEIEKLEYDGNKLSVTTSDAILIAQQLLSAMDQYGTDEETIVTLLTDLNRDDLLFVIKLFGIKQYNGAGQSVGLDKYLYSQNLNLAGWLKAELEDSPKYYDQVKAIFKNHNIPF